MDSSFAWLRDGRVRLILMLVILLALAVYGFASGRDVLGLGSDPSAGAADDCPAGSAPDVAGIDRSELAALRNELLGTVAFDHGAERYEEGPVTPEAAWTDMEPGVHTSLPSDASQPGAYEVRWWLPSRDDLVADVMVFGDAGEARDYFTSAASTECRSKSVSPPAPLPEGGRNVQWRNPESVAQEDVFFQRGDRVYRVAVVRAGAKATTTPAERRAAFGLVNAYACLLPAAECPAPGSPGPSVS